VTLGFLFVTAIDCDGSPASGVSFRLTPAQPDSRLVYAANGVADIRATETDDTGIAGFVSLRAGTATVIASRKDEKTGRPVDIGEVTVTVEAGTVSYVRLRPRTKNELSP